MPSNEIESRVKSIIENNAPLQVPVEQIGPEDDLFGLGMDSINILKVIVAIESEFGFVIDDEDLNIDNFRNMQKIISYIKRRLENV